MIYKTFNYKLQIRLEGDELARRTDLFWQYLFREVAARGFTGVVFYGEEHPFEHVLDYKTFPHAIATPAAVRTRQREAFNRMLAHAYGLKTFVQHYVWHFPAAPAKHAGLDIREGGYARLSGYDIPVIVDYCRYCYREVFRQCPDLDGLYFNFGNTLAE
ncbi:MAG: hypothetical protein ABIF71_02095 [Planctomycetota bacterium]